jgi:hypothetical protein
MSAQTRDLYVEMGTTVRRSFVWYPRTSVTLAADGSVSAVIGPPFNLTGCSARMQIRKKPGTAVLVSITTASGGIVLGGQTGEIDFVLSATLTSTLPAKAITYELQYDLEVEFTSGDVRRVVEGKVTVSPDITR